MPNNTPPKDKQRPNKVCTNTRQKNALKEKYKTQAEKYNNKAIPGDQTDLTGKELMLMGNHSNTQLMRITSPDIA